MHQKNSLVQFIRIRGSKVFSNEEESMKKVINNLKELEIYLESINDSVTNDIMIKGRIIFRTEEIRAEWKNSYGNSIFTHCIIKYSEENGYNISELCLINYE